MGIGLSFVTLLSLANPSENYSYTDYYEETTAALDTPRIEGDRYGDEFSDPPSQSPLNIDKPSNVETKVELNEDLTGYTIYEKVGEMDYRPVSEMTFQEFAEYKKDQMMREYWDHKTDSLDKRPDEEIKPPLWTFGKKGDPLVEIRPSGNVTLNFGARFQKTENPAIPVSQQSSGGFDFDQQISLNLAGKIGDRIRVNANWDTKAAFDFDNTIKVSFEGKDTDILKSLEAGNVSMPLNNSLVRGGQNLFGIKARLKFGRLEVTTLLSSQRGTSESITIRNGGQFRPFNLQATDYDEQRHFFLSQEFRNRFERAYRINPANPTTGIRITRVEVYRTNLQTRAENQRNIVALTDLGESNVIQNSIVQPNPGFMGGDLMDNQSNNMWDLLNQDTTYRDPENLSRVLGAKGFISGIDFEKVNGAIRIPESQYTFHPDLGYITLNSKLRDNEALAVSYEYTFEGENYKVGEMMEDYQNLDKESVIVLKMLKPQSINITSNTWDLMMKNIYSLPTSNVNQDGFVLRMIYRDDLTGIDSPTLQDGGSGIEGEQLVQVFGLDKVNPNGALGPDGNFDFLENATINTRKGKIIFPHPEPFGDYLSDVFDGQFALQNKYVFNEIYDQTKEIAKRIAQKDKFAIDGFYQSGSSGDISLPGLNISEGSVVIQVGARTLSEGSDYSVDYRLGRIKILNEGILSSGEDIKITYEKADIFSFRTKSLLGTRLDYRINEEFNVGATIMRMSERPLISRVNIGDEPISNIQVGVDVKFKDESRLLTKAVDKLPVIQTKAKSNVAVNWEAAMLKPGTSSILGSGGTSYIDDFEGAETPIAMDQSVKSTWMISSTPAELGNSGVPYRDATSSGLDYGYHRAKVSTYTMLDLYNNANVQDNFNLTDEQVDLLISRTGNPYTREYEITDVFPNRQPLNGSQTLGSQRLINFSYYPDKRGPYNYNTNEVDANGNLTNPENNWGGVTRPITTDNDFENRNVQFLEFWMLDPFLIDPITGQAAINEVLPAEYQGLDVSDLGGEMYFNIGEVSEDFMQDGSFAFENHSPDNVDTTTWGLTPSSSEQFLTNAFDNNIDRSIQDVGLDGLSNDEEANFFVNQGAITQTEANNLFNGDISSDDFTYWDEPNKTLLERYMNANGLENNSPENTSGGLIRQVKSTPDKEALTSTTVLENNNYWQFKMDLNRSTLNTNNPFVVDSYEPTNQTARWYQVRIPINNLTWQAIGGVSNFKNIKHLRVYFTKFKKPIVVRMAQFQFVSSQWVIADKNALNEKGFSTKDEPQDPNFNVSTVNVEENGQGSDVSSPYDIPPGTIRDFDQTSNTGRQINEQSLRLCVDDLQDGESRGVFKNITTPPLYNYGQLKMFVHAETVDPGTGDGEVSAFMRIGTDQFQNYYEVEVPLTFSNIESADQNEIWRAENEFDINIADLIAIKAKRKAQGFETVDKFVDQLGKYKVTIKGSPELSNAATWMIGVRNPKDGDNNKSFCVWVDELRATDFDQSVGYATTGSIVGNLADLGTFNMSTKITTVGYGDIDQKVSEREQANTVQWGVGTDIAMDKFIPAKTGVKLPLHVSYDKTTVDPKYDPLNADVELDAISKTFNTEQEAVEYENKVKYKATVKSIQLQGVRKEKVKPDAKKHIYDIENFTLGAGYTETKKSGMGGNDGFGNNLQSYLKQEYNGSMQWGYSPQAKPFAPFKKSKALKGKYFKLIKDFNVNFVPNSFSVRGDLNRRYEKTVYYISPSVSNNTLTPIYKKNFTFDRTYNMRWNITKSISFTYNATANAVVDEPRGDKEGDNTITRQQYRDSVRANLRRFGRMTNYQQTSTLTYKVPLSKIPLVNWINADVSYKTGYNWRANIVGLTDINDPPEAYGNFISNTRDVTFNGKLNLVKLYNKNKFLKSINSPRRKPKRKPPPKTNKEGEEEEKPKKDLKGMKVFVRSLMAVRSINGRYSLSYNTSLPGFLPTPRFLGFDDRANNAPGSAFLLGSQDLDAYKELAVQNDWLSRSTSLNDPIIQTRTENYNVKATVEPIKNFRIQLTGKYKETSSFSEVFRYNGNGYESFNPLVNGNLNMSYVYLNTAFWRESGDNVSEAFTLFERNRNAIRTRLDQEVNNKIGQFSNNSQDVLIPAFRAAYLGQDGASADLNAAPKFPLPNWRINYAGLSKVKAIKKIFSSFTITHGYTGTYEIGGYTSSLSYDSLDPSSRVNQRFSDLDTNGQGLYISPFVVSGVRITERFSPLIGFNIRTKSRISIRIDYNVSRMLDLDMANLQVTEENSRDFVIGLGYTKKGLKLPIKSRSREQIVLKNNVTMKMDLSIRDTRTIQRAIEGDNVVTAGNVNFQLRPNISYEVNQRVNLQIFFERTVNSPRISTSFPRSTTAFGVRLRFSLT